MITKLTPSMALQVESIGGSNDFEIFTSHYKAFTRILNLFIMNKSNTPMANMLEMYTQVSEYFESCMVENSWDTILTSDYIDGMVWFFNECCPEGFIFDGERYVEHG